MYCPQCGRENSVNSKFCEYCGEDLDKISVYKKNKNILVFVGIILFFGAISAIYSGQGLIFAVLLILILIFAFLYKPILSRLSGPHANKYCPRCEESDFNEKFCVKCGYNLEDVLGYFTVSKNYIEVNKNYLNIYERIRMQQKGTSGRPGVHSHKRYGPYTYYLDKINNLHLSQCKNTISKKPCLKFNYDSPECKNPPEHKSDGKCLVYVIIDKKTEKEMDNLFSMGYYDNSAHDNI